ncbi:60_t:CDS:1, partial [Paraglomus occultum]
MFRLKNRNRLSKRHQAIDNRLSERHQAIDNLIQSSSVDDKYFHLEWISGSEFNRVGSR